MASNNQALNDPAVAVSEFIRARMQTQSMFRRIMPPMSISDDDLIVVDDSMVTQDTSLIDAIRASYNAKMVEFVTLVDWILRPKPKPMITPFSLLIYAAPPPRTRRRITPLED